MATDNTGTYLQDVVCEHLRGVREVSAFGDGNCLIDPLLLPLVLLEVLEL